MVLKVVPASKMDRKVEISQNRRQMKDVIDNKEHGKSLVQLKVELECLCVGSQEVKTDKNQLHQLCIDKEIVLKIQPTDKQEIYISLGNEHLDGVVISLSNCNGMLFLYPNSSGWSKVQEGFSALPECPLFSLISMQGEDRRIVAQFAEMLDHSKKDNVLSLLRELVGDKLAHVDSKFSKELLAKKEAALRLFKKFNGLAEKRTREVEDVENDKCAKFLKNDTDQNENFLNFTCPHCPFKTLNKRGLSHHHTFAHGSKEQLEGIRNNSSKEIKDENNASKNMLKDKISKCPKMFLVQTNPEKKLEAKSRNGTKVITEIIDDILDMIIVNKEKLPRKIITGTPKIKGVDKTSMCHLKAKVSICPQCSFKTLDKRGLEHHNACSHSKVLDYEVKKPLEEIINIHTNEIIDEDIKTMDKLKEKLSNDAKEDETICIFDDDLEQFYSSDSDIDNMDETMSSLPDIVRSNSMESQDFPVSPTKSFDENEQSAEMLDISVLFPHLIKTEKDGSKSLGSFQQSDEEFRSPSFLNSLDVIPSDVNLSLICSSTGEGTFVSSESNSQVNSSSNSDCDVEMEGQSTCKSEPEENCIAKPSDHHEEKIRLANPLKENEIEPTNEANNEKFKPFKKYDDEMVFSPKANDDLSKNCIINTSEANEYAATAAVSGKKEKLEDPKPVNVKIETNPIKPDILGYFGLVIHRIKNSSDELLERIALDFKFFGDLASLAWRKVDNYFDAIVKFDDYESAAAALMGLQEKYKELSPFPPSDIGTDQNGRFTLIFQDKKDKRYAGTKKEFFKYGSKHPIICKGEGKRLVRIAYFDKDGALEAFKQNISNPEFPELQIAPESEVCLLPSPSI